LNGLTEVPQPRSVAGGLRGPGWGSVDGLGAVATTKKQAPCKRKAGFRSVKNILVCWLASQVSYYSYKENHQI
jgi:hypothetical protein